MIGVATQMELQALKRRIAELERQVRALQGGRASFGTALPPAALTRTPLHVPLISLERVVIGRRGLHVVDESGDLWNWFPDDTSGNVTVGGVTDPPV